MSEAIDKDKFTAQLALDGITAAIQDLHNSLDLREHGDVAAWNAIHKIEEVLGMPWAQGAEQARRAEKIKAGK